MSRPTPGAVLNMGAPHLLEMRALEPKNDAQLQRLVGPRGFETLKWYRTGLERASAVAAVTERLGLRFGTGFAVRAEDFGVVPGDEVLLLTNFHVLNSAGLGGRRDFGNVEVVFDAIDEEPLKYSVGAVVAESDADGGLDYALLRLSGATERLRPLPISLWIASAGSNARVYVIGYPLGDVMQFSLQDQCPPRPRVRTHREAAKSGQAPRAVQREHGEGEFGQPRV